MTNAEEILKKAGVIRHGHFLLASGLHSPVYWEKFQVLQYPKYTEQLCKMIAEHFRDQKIDLVAGPTTGGVILAYEVARQLGVRGIFAEKTTTGARAFRRGFSIEPGEQGVGRRALRHREREERALPQIGRASCRERV